MARNFGLFGSIDKPPADATLRTRNDYMETSLDLQFVEMDQTSDFDEYDRLARAEMSIDDLVSGEELRDLLADRKGRAWWVHMGNQQRIAWCSIMQPAPGPDPDSGAVHILGTIVFGTAKGKGIGKDMLKWLIQQFGDHPLTAAISPSNIASMRMFKAASFAMDPSVEIGPWQLWKRT